MRPLIHRVARLILTVAVVTISTGLPSSKGADRLLAVPGKFQDWKLANGDLVKASIVSYSRHRRIITLELPSGKLVHVAPRDLAGASKYDWLTSDAFILSLSGYTVPTKAALPVVQSFLALFIGSSLGLFLAFWAAIALLTGHRSLRPAFVVFSKCFLLSVGIAAAGAAFAWALDNFLAPSASVVMGISAVYLITIAFILAMTCRIVGCRYGTSEWTGIQAMFLAIFLFAVGSLVIVIGMPRAMNQPGIDEWLTEQVLTPLELA